MNSDIWMVLDVNPEPWAIGPVGYARHGGKMSAYVGRNQQLAAYQEAVREAVRDQWGALPMLQGDISLDLFFWRNRAEYTTPNARQHRKHDADATNLQKGTEDALQGILFDNDKDNRAVSSVIMAQGPDVIGKIALCIQEIDAEEYVSEVFDEMPEKVRRAVAKLNLPKVAPMLEQNYGDNEETF